MGAKMTGGVFTRRDSDVAVPKPKIDQKLSFKTRSKQEESKAPKNETDKQKKERKRKLEEEQKVNFKDVLEVQMSGGYKNERPPIFIYNIIQVICLSPVVLKALVGLMKQQPDQRKYMPPTDIIKQYNSDTLRMIRTNYEMMISSWADRTINKILPKHCISVIEIDQNQRSAGNSLLGLEMRLNTGMFTFVLRYTQMLAVIVYNVPLGFVNEDNIYK